MEELTLTVTDCISSSRWRWELAAPDGRVVADHDVELDESDWRYEAFSDLYRYLRLHVTPDRQVQREAEIVAQVATWVGKEVLGQVAAPVHGAARTGPLTVRVVVPDEPPAARQIAYLPLELAEMAGKPLALQGVTFVMRAGAQSGRPWPVAVGDRLRVLALFSAPDGRRPLSLRRERVALVRLFDEINLGRGRAADLRVLQYGVTRDRLQEMLRESEGWDIIHISGHGQPGELLLETVDGSHDPVSASDLADLLYLARDRVKLVMVSACSSAALTVEQQMRVLGVRVPADDDDSLADPGQPPGGAVADELALRLDCAVLAMRYPVIDNFAADLSERLYRLIAANGQPVPAALGLALPELVKEAPTPSCPAISVATPTLFGGLAPGLMLAAPTRTALAFSECGESGLVKFPAPPERFAGRVALMARSNAALAPRSGVSGLLLHGMPGGGKTACALELAHTHEHAFENFVWYQAPDDDHDITAAFTDLALALEATLTGLKVVHLLDDPEGLTSFWPVLTELCQHRRVLFVIDNAESLLAESGQWRDPRFGNAVAALSAHPGLSRLVMTSRTRPDDLPARMRVEQVDALPLEEALLIARELPGLAALMNGTAPGIAVPAARALARRALECAQGHPKLLDLADGASDDPAALSATLDEIADTWRREGTPPEESFAPGKPAADPGSYMRVLTEWTRSAAALLSADGRDLFWFLCCMEPADRTSDIVKVTWPQARSRLALPEEPPEIDSLLAALIQQALVTGRSGRDDVATSFGIHPAVVAAGRSSAGTAFQAAVDIELGSYWIAANRIARQREVSHGSGAGVVAAGLRAAPYLLRSGRWDEAIALLEDSLARDHSRTTIAAAIPPLRKLAAALRGQPNEPAAVGTLARALRMLDPAAAERELASMLEAAVRRRDYVTGFVASDDLCEITRESGRLSMAMTYAKQSRDLADRAGCGPWTLLAAERSRLLVLLEQGHAEQVLDEVRDLTDQAKSLPSEPGENEIVMPWMTQESLLDTGRAAALRLSQWDRALTFNGAAMASMRRRGASAADLARARFGDYGPLLGLGRTDEAFAVVQECKAAAEQDRDIEMLGVVFGALAEVEDARGHQDVAADRCRDSLRYLYLAGNPADVAGGHTRLGSYIGRGGVSHPIAITQFLAAALLHELSGTRQAGNAVNAAAAHLRAAENDSLLPAAVTELSASIQDIPGCDLPGLLDRIWPDAGAVEHAYQEIAHRVRTAAARPSGSAAITVQWDPVIAALRAAAGGSAPAAETAGNFLSALESQAGRPALAKALRMVLSGDRDAAGLTRNLDEPDAVVVERALDVIGGRIEVPRVLWRAVPIAGSLLDLVMACRGVPMAPARARQGLARLSGLQEWSGLAPVLERILAGERGAILYGRLTQPAHRAIVELVLREIAATGPSG